MNTNGTEPNRAPALAATGEAVEPATATHQERPGIVQRRLVSGWHFTRHLLEMVLAMVAGMALLGAAFAALGEPPGYANLFVRYGLMDASMAAPMVAWMRYRGHSWSDGGEDDRGDAGSDARPGGAGRAGRGGAGALGGFADGALACRDDRGMVALIATASIATRTGRTSRSRGRAMRRPQASTRGWRAGSGPTGSFTRIDSLTGGPVERVR